MYLSDNTTEAGPATRCSIVIETVANGWLLRIVANGTQSLRIIECSTAGKRDDIDFLLGLCEKILRGEQGWH